MGFNDLMNRNTIMEKRAEAANAIDALGAKKFDSEANFYKLELNKDGKNTVKLRFLPPADGDAMNMTQRFEHKINYQSGSNTKFAVFNCATTIGGECPVCALNKRLWDMGEEEVVRKRKRQNTYYANVYIISDEATPENNGKRFVYRFGKTIFDKIREGINGEFGDPVNPFAFLDGNEFSLIAVKKNDGGFGNDYSRSNFTQTPSDLLGGDMEKVKAVYDDLESIDAFRDPKKFEVNEDFLNRVYESVLPDLKGKNGKPDTEPTQEDVQRNRDNSRATEANEKIKEDEIPFNMPEPTNESGVGADLMAQLESLVSDD